MICHLSNKRARDIDSNELKGSADDRYSILSSISPPKRQRSSQASKQFKVPPSSVGLTSFTPQDVLSGRGGGTNQHEGNCYFRSLINNNRERYLKSKKNDKPFISRSIVNAIRKKNGRFLKKDEDSDLWYEIGDDAAREKTSQALRQKAPELRKQMFEKSINGQLSSTLSVSPTPSSDSSLTETTRTCSPLVSNEDIDQSYCGYLIELECLKARLRKAQMAEMQSLLRLKREEQLNRDVMALMMRLSQNY